MATAVVKGPSNKYFSNFEEACEVYLAKIFPDFGNWKLNETLKTYMFPPRFSCRYQAPIDEASGAMRLTTSEEADVKGDDAELKIFRTLDKFGREMEQPMFVFTNIKFVEFKEEVLNKNLPETLVEYLVKHFFTDLRPEDWTREIDFLIVHRRVGIILIEVKATEKFKKNRYQDAKNQLEIGEKFICSLLRMLDLQNFPIFKVVAMPNICITQYGQKSEYINLRSENLENDDDLTAFNRWWRHNFEENHFSPEDVQGLLKLSTVLVGQRAAIGATAKILAEVFKIIDKQAFLEKSYKKQAGKHSEAHAIQKPTEESRLVILAKQFLFLNPEQLLIWDGPTQQIFCGAPGSGKTILLQHKALECAKNQEPVVVFVPPPLDFLYREYFAQNEVSADTVTVVTYTMIENFLARYPKQAYKCHIFIDEFQVLLNTNQELLDLLKRFMAENRDSQHYQWIVYDILQLSVANEVFGIKRSSVNVVQTISSLLQEQSFIHAPSLTTVMRNTSEVYEFLQDKYLRKYSNFSGYLKKDETPASSAASHDLDSFWKHPIYLGHRVCGPQVIVKSSASREPPFKIIENEIHEWAKENDEYHYFKVAVLLSFQRMIIDFTEHLWHQKVPVCQIGSTENAVVVDSAENARSYEWPVVIAVIANIKSMQNYISFSRAVTRLVMLLWKPI